VRRRRSSPPVGTSRLGQSLTGRRVEGNVYQRDALIGRVLSRVVSRRATVLGGGCENLTSHGCGWGAALPGVPFAQHHACRAHGLYVRRRIERGNPGRMLRISVIAQLAASLFGEFMVSLSMA